MKKQSGFTLVEVMVASFMLITVVSVAGAFWYFTQRNYEFSVTQYRLTENVSRAVRAVAQEIRETQDAMDGAYPLALLGDNELMFYSDINNDGLIERVHYWVNNQTLYRGVVVPTGDPPQYVAANEKATAVAEQLSTSYSPLFTYYNGDWPGDITHNPLATASRMLQTRMIQVSIPITIHDANGPSSFSAQTTVQLRNLKDNL